MRLIPACMPCQRQHRVSHLLATGQKELVSRRTRRGRPQAHRMSAPVRRRQSQACQPEEVNQNNDSKSFVWRTRVKRLIFLLLQEMLRWVQTLQGRQAPARSLAGNPDNSILHIFWMKVPLAWAVRAVKLFIEKALLRMPTEDTAFPHPLWCRGRGVPGWYSLACDRDQSGEAG